MSAPVVFFDGHCALCAFWVRFLLARDRRHRYRFASLDSYAARASGISSPPGSEPDTVILMRDERLWERSDAAIRIVAGLGGMWRACVLLLLVPRVIRDAVYRWVARNRYRWFGRTEACFLPDARQRELFLD
jgi:predicted DCC family thiol-disulfide oxidoreductase YuxK